MPGFDEHEEGSQFLELELPRGFRRSDAREWLRRIPEGRLRTIAANKLEDLLARAAGSGHR